jgi:hypothetical protein
LKLDALLRAHAFMQVERPPQLWEAATDDRDFIPLLGEMIAAMLDPHTLDLGKLTLNAANVVVSPDAEGRPPEGEYVAVTVSGLRGAEADAAWLPGQPPAAGLLRALDERLARAGVRYAYVRKAHPGGSVTVFLSRAAA